MMKRKSFYPAFVCLLFMAFVRPEKEKTSIWLIGDSTMSVKEVRAYPETGWGMPFVYYWDSTVVVNNRAKNGRSTKSFMAEGLWKPVLEKMKKDDYVFIQFGHNDEVSTKKTYTTEKEFRDNLVKYISETRDRKAVPVLLTPVARRKFDAAGKIEGTHEVYAQIVRDVAKEQQVVLIDLDRKSQALYQHLGVEASKLLFLHLAPGEHPNYPDGKEDNTHFSELGARRIASLVSAEIKLLLPDLAKRLINRSPK